MGYLQQQLADDERTSGRGDQSGRRKAPHVFLAPGDTLAVPALDRYGRSQQDPIALVGELRKREIGFTSPCERLDTTTPGERGQEDEREPAEDLFAELPC
ncbi:recombinase family protein [Streptomyces virginiae]|uniref:recombinase family protein n=1 Tax=Streptomyces virginiae TaxID=1961 RepID=UPI00371128F0